MSLPVTLPANTVSIYGHHSLNDIVSYTQGAQFGVIDKMYFGADTDRVGESVFFLLANATRVFYDNTQYFLLPEQDIIFTENIPEEEF